MQHHLCELSSIVALLPQSPLCPLKFPGDFIPPVSNRVATQFTIPLSMKTRTPLRTILQIEQNMICQMFSPPCGYLSTPLSHCDPLPPPTPLSDAVTESLAPRPGPDGSVRQAQTPLANRCKAGGRRGGGGVLSGD